MTDRSRRPFIVGTGIAGLYVALRVRELGLKPVLLTKARLEESNTRYAQGGIAAAIGADDSPRLHLEDTLRAGGDLVDRTAAKILTEEAPLRIADLVRYGVPFDTIEGQIQLGREAAHSRSRILHAGGDATGLSIEETIRQRVLDLGVEVRERCVLRALRPLAAGVIEATVSNAEGGETETLDAAPVVLASGGAGSLFRQSSNPPVATGDGMAIAFRAGALLTDMEFVQFHPTTFCREGAPRFLITEALRGEGAVLLNEAGERFMPDVHPDAELAPRDVVARAIVAEIERSGAPCVYLDATRVPRDRLYARFPSVSRFLAAFGLDLARDRIPVAPAAHYTVGGVATDHEARTSIPGLYAVGEVACTGVHGANRLGSNSLLEGLVFGEHAARQLVHPAPGGPAMPARRLVLAWPPGSGWAGSDDDLQAIKDGLWEFVGIVRSAAGLQEAIGLLERIGRRSEPSDPSKPPSDVANAALTGWLIAEAALARTESRGAHFRQDWPRPRAVWNRHLGLLAAAAVRRDRTKGRRRSRPAAPKPRR